MDEDDLYGYVDDDVPAAGRLALGLAVASVGAGVLVVAGAVVAGAWVRSATWDRRHRGR